VGCGGAGGGGRPAPGAPGPPPPHESSSSGQPQSTGDLARQTIEKLVYSPSLSDGKHGSEG